MSVERDRDEIAIAIDVKDATLADRLSRMLGDVASVRLVKGDERADAVIVTPGTAPITADVVQLAEDEHSAVESKALTPREREVLVLLAEGATNKTIARRLGISVHTAKFHVGSLIDKLDAAGRTDAVAHAARLGVIVL